MSTPTIDKLLAEVTANPDLKASVEHLARGLGTLLKGEGVDPNRVLTFATQLQTRATELASAVIANMETVDVNAPPEPEPEPEKPAPTE